MKLKQLLALISTTSVLGACSVMPPADFPRENYVDVDRYMGDWYVIAHIPPGKSANGYNNIETYSRGQENKINTVFTFREGSFTGEEKKMEPTGMVLDESGSAWAMQFFWPLKMEFTIHYVSDNYDSTIVARSARDYVWIMAREPEMAPAKYQQLVDRVAKLGYDMSKLRKVPQQPLYERNAVSLRQ